MSKIVVNREQYMTCRLCLEEQGSYTIVPHVKDQIEYCFGIEIQPFDGMPQLICEKCEKILCNYSQLKKKYIENQVQLKTKILAHQFDKNKFQVTAPRNKSSSESPSENNERSKPKRKGRVISTSSSEDASYNKSRKTRQRTVSKESLRSNNSSPKGYTKQYVCRICNTRWSNVLLINNHVNSKHGHLYKKYGHIIRKHCLVSIPKIDLGSPDHGFADKIMFSKDKIVKSVRGSYFITYTTRNYKDGTSNSRPSSGLSNRGKRKQKHLFNDSSDEEDVCTLKRRKRLGTASSTDTINLETKTETTSDTELVTMDAKNTFPPPTDLGECILLDDSSDNESRKSETQKTKPETGADTKTEPKVENNTINEILNSCRTKYIKKHILDSFSLKSAKNPSEVATQLKRKVLSVGRKIINRKIGINCTPLARFLENKNLDIAWIPRENSQVHDANFEANYIHIMTRTRQAGEKENADNETGWSDYINIPSSKAAVSGSNTEPVPTAGPIVMINGVNGQINGIQVVSGSMPELQNLFVESNTGGGKLLNANPVANPKQLPRKSVLGDVTLNVPVTEEISEEPCMPIIMSTTSLAVSKTDQREVPSKPFTPKPAEAPRIKVKPVSELMSAATLQRMKTPQNSNMVIQSSKVTIPPGSFSFVPRVTAGALPPANALPPAPSQEQGSDSMVLNTVELPNKTTNAPFLYFRNLLQIHNLMLLDTYSELSSEFHCLIKFKVMYKQDNQNNIQSVALCIALHCARNVFCFKIKDRNQQNIDMAKITANWQWEILKIFKGEVVPKVLLSAQKIGGDQYEYTNKFLCLLKSIDLVQ